MRYPSNHKQNSHARILAEAGRLFREQGYQGCGVDGVMEAAGLTAGGFYAHFASKQALLAEILACAIERTRAGLLAGLENTAGVDWLQQIVGRYLNAAHRDRVGGGCALPPLLSELARAPKPLRQAFHELLLQIVSELATKMPPSPGLDAQDRTLATLALFVGGLSLARAVTDPALSERILGACRLLAVPEAAVPVKRPAKARGGKRTPRAKLSSRRARRQHA